MNNLLKSILKATGSLALTAGLVAGMYGTIQWAENRPEKKDNEKSRSDTIIYFGRGAVIVPKTLNRPESNTSESSNTSTTSNTSSLSDKVMDEGVANAVKAVAQKTYYNGLEVEAMKSFPNAKLLGVDSRFIPYYSGEGSALYPVKGLLFELDSGKVVNLISKDIPVYAGQRYDISYHPMKQGVVVDGERLIRLFGDMNRKPISGTRYDDVYEGILINNQLKRRDGK